MKKLLAIILSTMFVIGSVTIVKAGLPIEDCSILTPDLNDEVACPPFWDNEPTENDEAAERDIHARRCRTMKRFNAQHTQSSSRTICNAVNAKSFQWKFEGLFSWDHSPDDSDHVKVYIDWIHLVNNQNGNILKFKNNQGWFDCTGHCGGGPDAYGTSEDSWWGVPCNDTPVRELISKVRYKIKWMDLPGDPVGTWHTFNSGVYGIC